MVKVDARLLNSKARNNKEIKKHIKTLKGYAASKFPDSDASIAQRACFVYCAEKAAMSKSKGKSVPKRELLTRMASIHNEGTDDY